MSPIVSDRNLAGYETSLLRIESFLLETSVQAAQPKLPTGKGVELIDFEQSFEPALVVEKKTNTIGQRGGRAVLLDAGEDAARTPEEHDGLIDEVREQIVKRPVEPR